jgi:hypothetical protein
MDDREQPGPGKAPEPGQTPESELTPEPAPGAGERGRPPRPQLRA